jgi:hypothetical protein
MDLNGAETILHSHHIQSALKLSLKDFVKSKSSKVTHNYAMMKSLIQFTKKELEFQRQTLSKVVEVFGIMIAKTHST